MTPESNQPADPPPLASWWGHTGLLYVGLSALAAAVGYAVGWLFLAKIDADYFVSVSDYLLLSVQRASFYGSAIAVAQWLVLRRLVRRALCSVSGCDLTHAERRLVRNTALWIVVTIVGMVIGGAFIELLGGLWHWFEWASDMRGLPQSLCVGLILGTAQWLVLRRQVPGAGHWILWTMSGTIIGTVAQGDDWLLKVVYFMSASRLLADLASLSLFVAIYTAMQSACLKRLAPGWMKRLHDAARTVPSVS
jgi:hypothetical protein